MNAYLITFSNIAHYITYRVVARDDSEAREVATKIAHKLDNEDIAQEEYEMQTGDEPQHHEREAWDYTLNDIEEDGTVEGEDARKLRKATKLLELDRLQVDAGGNG